MSPTREPEDHLPLTPRVFHILLALAGGERHGYGIMKTAEERSHGLVKIGPGTLYEAIHRLVDAGLLAESSVLPAPDEDQRRRYYGLTPLGRRVLRMETERVVELARTAEELTRSLER